MDLNEGQLFDPSSDFDQWDRTRPHRHQPLAVCFLTMRLNDSIPKSVVQSWHRQRLEYLARHGVDCSGDWKVGLQSMTPEQLEAFNKHFSRQRESMLDNCLGQCQLANPEAAEEVTKSLLNFHGDRYWMGDFVIMPNHVHCLVAFKSVEIAKTQPGGWMRYSATKINKLLVETVVYGFPSRLIISSEAIFNWNTCGSIFVKTQRRLDSWKGGLFTELRVGGFETVCGLEIREVVR